MLSTPIAFIDVETTGADPRSDRITEVGIVEMAGGCVISEWSTLVNPGRPIPSGIEALTGITNEMVASAPSFADISLDLSARLHGRLFVAHNARFDYGFVRNELRRASLHFQSDVLCTVRLSRQMFPDERHHNLDALIERFGLVCPERHRALADARVLVDLIHAFGRAASPERLQRAVAQAMQRPHLPPGIAPELLDDLPDAAGVYLLYDAQGAPLYASKAANLRSQLLADLSSNANYARALRAAAQSGSVEWRVTAGPVGAALREMRLIEDEAPRYNRRPRLQPDAFALQWRPEQRSRVTVVDLNRDQPLPPDQLYGPFRSRADSLAALRGIAREHGLCAIELGLESGHGPCTGRTAGTCRGACVGQENPLAHLVRMGLALGRLRMPAWPFKGAVAIVEEDAVQAVTEFHVASDWRYLGSTRSPSEIDELQRLDPLPAFDVDLYRILLRVLRDHTYARLLDLPGSRRDQTVAAHDPLSP